MGFLLFGKTGHLGWYLASCLESVGNTVAYNSQEVDFRSSGLLDETIRKVSPDIVINAVAYTDVDGAEQFRDQAMRINTDACAELAYATKAVGATLIHYSTDYIFDGSAAVPYKEDAPPAPLNVYGLSKLRGEQAIIDSGCKFLILRTSWLYSSRRESFVSKVLRWARTSRNLRIVNDQISSPTWSKWLAQITAQLIQRKGADLQEYGGIYHVCAQGQASRYEWAKAILKFDPHKEEQSFQSIQPASSQEFPTAAQRPPYSVLDTQKFKKTFGGNILSWEQMLAQSLHNEFVR